jgi:hypothetical protein
MTASPQTDRRRGERERRGARRAPLTAGVLDGARLAQTANIGPAGMTLMRRGDDGSYEAAHPLELAFQLPGDEDVIRVAAEVVFDRPAGAYRATGVRFRSLEGSARERIAAFIAAR